jgi:hypothetical protein
VDASFSSAFEWHHVSCDSAAGFWANLSVGSQFSLFPLEEAVTRSTAYRRVLPLPLKEAVSQGHAQ